MATRRRKKRSGSIGKDIIDALDEIQAAKGIRKEFLIEALEDAIGTAYKRHHDLECDVSSKMDGKGCFRVWVHKTVVETAEDETTEIAQSEEAARGKPLGGVVPVEVSVEEFGRIAAQTAKQVILQRIRDAERRLIFDEFRDKEGQLANGKVQRVRDGNLIVELGKTEAILPRRELPGRERYREGDRIKAVILNVKMSNKGPQVVLSRSHPMLVRRLFEMEVSEVYDKTVEIMTIAREPGSRSKIAVLSHDQAVDPVGACVGQRGIRVQTVVRELGGERIDIVRWDKDPKVFIKNALAPAEVENVDLDDEARTATVTVPDDQLSLAIGKEGQNARLAARLSGWRIDIRSRGEEARAAAVDMWSRTFGLEREHGLSEFPGLREDLIASLAGAGFGTIEAVASASVPDLAGLGDMDEKEASDLRASAQEALAAKADESGVVVVETAPGAPFPGRDDDTAAGEVVEPPEREEPEEPFLRDDGSEITGREELMEHLDHLSGEALEDIVTSGRIERWLSARGFEKNVIEDTVSRYRM